MYILKEQFVYILQPVILPDIEAAFFSRPDLTPAILAATTRPIYQPLGTLGLGAQQFHVRKVAVATSIAIEKEALEEIFNLGDEPDCPLVSHRCQQLARQVEKWAFRIKEEIVYGPSN